MKKFLAVLSMFLLLGSQSSIALGQTRIFRGSQGQLTDVEGVQAEGSGTLPKPILIGGDNGTDITNILVDLQGHLQVDVLSAALPTGAATAANQVLEIALLTTIDADTSALFGTVAGSEQQVDVVTSALPTGAATEATLLDVADVLSADILDALTGHEGDFQAVFGTPLAFNVDSIAGATAGGIAALVLRDDVLTTLTPIDGDYVRLRVNSVGALHVVASGAALSLNSEYAEDSIAANLDIGQFVLGVSNEALGILVADGDYVAFATDQTGRTLGIPMTSSSFSFAEQLGKPEDSLHATGDSGVPAWGVRNDGASTVFTAVNLEYTPIATDGNGVVFMQGRRAEDSISAGGQFVLPIGVIRDDVLETGGGVGSDGDYNFVRVDNEGQLWMTGTHLEDAIAVTGDKGVATLGVAQNILTVRAAEGDWINPTFSTAGAMLVALVRDPNLGPDRNVIKREDDPSADLDAAVTVHAIRDDVLVANAEVTGDGDYLPFRTDNFGSLWGALTASDGARIPATVADGLLVNLGTNNDVTVPVSGTSFFSEKETAIAAASINFSFGFTSKKIIIETDSANGDEVCIDWLGGTAVCPAANTAGDDRVGAGRAITLDDMAVTSISIISSSGTNTVTVRAWN